MQKKRALIERSLYRVASNAGEYIQLKIYMMMETDVS